MPGVLSAADIAEFRGLVATLAFPDTFVLVRDTEVSDGAGGRTLSTATIAAGDCRLRATGSGTERTIAEQLGWQAAYAVDVSPAVDVRPSDRITVNGRALEIGAVVDSGAWSMVKTLVCQEQP